MTEIEKQILKYLKEYELSDSGDVIIYTTEFEKFASEIASLFEGYYPKEGMVSEKDYDKAIAEIGKLQRLLKLIEDFEE